MSKLNDLRIDLAKRILESSDEDQLRQVEGFLNPPAQFRLSAAQKAELDRDLSDYEAGKGRNYSWAEVKAHARSVAKK